MKKVLGLALAAMAVSGMSLMAYSRKDLVWAKSGIWRKAPARDFSGADVRGIDFSGAWLEGADFSDSIQDKGTNFDRANVYGANFDDVKGEAKQDRKKLERKGARF